MVAQVIGKSIRSKGDDNNPVGGGGGNHVPENPSADRGNTEPLQSAVELAKQPGVTPTGKYTK